MKLEIQVNQDLTLSLYDASTGKTMKSVPKSGTDPEKYNAAKEKFARAKVHVKEIVTKQREQIQQDYFQDKSVPLEKWKSAYLKDAILSRVAALVVWKHVDGKHVKLFTLLENALVDSDGKPFEPSGGSVKVAGAFEMTQTESKSWQAYFMRNGLKQLYEQVWEPMISWDASALPDRYEGAELPKKERNRLKSRLKAAGIIMKSDEMEGYYNYSAGKYFFSDHNNVTIGKCLRIEYSIAQESGDWTLGKATLMKKYSTREMNKVILEIDRSVLRHLIATDRDDCLAAAGLEAYMATQIIEFLNVAISSESPKCTALLLNYKNAHFPEYSETDEFTLE